jgi:hypothetical protein
MLFIAIICDCPSDTTYSALSSLDVIVIPSAVYSSHALIVWVPASKILFISCFPIVAVYIVPVVESGREIYFYF